MDFEQQLINEVRVRPILYNRYMLGHRCRKKKNKAWISISLATGQPVQKCKKRWRSLRDRFHREVKKNSNQLVWKYFSLLIFLKNYMKIPNIDYRVNTNEEFDDNSLKDEFDGAKYPISLLPNNNGVVNNEILQIDYNNHVCSADKQDNKLNPSNFNYKSNLQNTSGAVKLEMNENTLQNFVQTITHFQHFMKGTRRNENGSFGLVVADMLATLPLQMCGKAKVHIMQYLSELQLQSSKNL